MDTHRWSSLPPGTSFFTPIGHHGKLLIYGPGGYQFGDFVKVGIPLTIIVAVIVSFLAPLLWTGQARRWYEQRV